MRNISIPSFTCSWHTITETSRCGYPATGQRLSGFPSIEVFVVILLVQCYSQKVDLWKFVTSGTSPGLIYVSFIENVPHTLKHLKFVIAVFLVCFLAAAGTVILTGLHDTIADADMIVVPGNAVSQDGTPSPRLKARLDAALMLFRNHRAPLVFVSGGIGKEGFDEAVAMSNYLLENGVPPSAIVKDSFGKDTAATAKNAADFMRSHHLKTALVATQYFHVMRTRLALERNGVVVTGTAHGSYFEMRDLYSIPREVAAYIKYFVEE